MSDNLYSVIGTKLYASATLPATNDKAGFEALAWTECQFMTTIPNFAAEKDIFTLDLMSEGEEVSRAGLMRFPEDTIVFANDVSEAGQIILEAAAYGPNKNNPIALKLEAPDGVDKVVYVKGIIRSFSDDNTEIAKANCIVKPVTLPLRTTKPTP